MQRSWCILIVTCAVAYSQGTSADVGRKADVYSIYSQMMTNPKTSHGEDNNQIYLIEGSTVPGYPREPCVRVPPANQSAFDEILADYSKRKDSPATLEAAFNIPKPYQLLNGDEVKEFMEERSPFQLSQKATDLFRLTDVYFDHNRTLALTAISTFCGGLCGMFQWRVFEKTGKGWEDRPRWVTCTAMARRRDDGQKNRLSAVSLNPGLSRFATRPGASPHERSRPTD
jgi:hypothetical protein